MLGLIALCFGAADAEPVVNWQVIGGPNDPPFVILRPDTGSPTIGDGSENGADQVGIWGMPLNDITLQNGRQVTLTGRVTIVGSTPAGNGPFRFGVFKDALEGQPRETPTGGWLGYLAGVSGADNDGFLGVRNPDDPAWAIAHPLATNPHAHERGGLGQVFILAEGGGTDPFGDGTYEFAINIQRYGAEVVVESTTIGLNLPGPSGDYNDDGSANAPDYTTWLSNLGSSVNLPNRDASSAGPISIDDYAAWKANFGATEASYNFHLSATDSDQQFPIARGQGGSPLPWTSHVPFEFDRVAILMADHLNADVAAFENIDLSEGPIESLELRVDRGGGVVMLKNNTSADIRLIYYEILSPEGILDEASWNSLAGGPTIDGMEWDEAAGSDNSILSEINLAGTPLMSPAGASQIHDFGSIYGGSSPTDENLSFFFIDTDGQLRRGTVTYFGDYSSQLVTAAVPEPAGLPLLLVALVLAWRMNVGRCRSMSYWSRLNSVIG